MHAVMPPDRESRALLAVLVAAAVLLHLAGCAAPAINCPPGAYPVNAAAERTASGGGDIGVSVPTASGTATGRYEAAGKAAWSCRPLTCPAGTALDYQQSERGTRVRCVPLVRPAPARKLRRLERADGGPDAAQPARDTAGMTPDTARPAEPIVRLFWSSPAHPGEALATLLAQRWELVGGVLLGGRVVWVGAVPGRGPGRAAG